MAKILVLVLVLSTAGAIYFHDAITLIHPNVGAALIAIVGIYLTNFSHNYRQKKQLQHEIDEERKSKSLDLRKDIYINAVASIVKLQSLIVRISTASHEETVALRDKIEEEMGNVSKVQLVASNELLRPFLKTVGLINSGLLTCIIKATEINSYRNTFKSNQEEILSRHTKIERGLSEAREADDRDIKGKILDEVQENIKVSDTFNENNKEIAEKIKTKSLEALSRAWEINKEIAISLVASLVAARKDIEIPLDETIVVKWQEEMLRNASSSLDNILQIVDSMKGQQNKS